MFWQFYRRTCKERRPELSRGQTNPFDICKKLLGHNRLVILVDPVPTPETTEIGQVSLCRLQNLHKSEHSVKQNNVAFLLPETVHLVHITSHTCSN